MKDKYLLIIIFALGLIFLIIGFSIWFNEIKNLNDLPKHNITVNCYDRQWNIIDNVTCSEEVFNDDRYNGINGINKAVLGLTSFMMGMVGFLLITLSIILYPKLF